MASNIDVTKPVTGNPTTQSVRDNFNYAKNEIEDLQQVRAIRLVAVNEAVESFQACAVNDVPQVIVFNQVVYVTPDSSASFEFDSVNNELLFHEIGWYDLHLSLHVVRKVAGATLADWSVHSELKLPSVGSFAKFPAGRRTRSFDGSIANFKSFFQISQSFQVTEAETKLRLMQTCTDVTKTIGVISYPATAALPSAAAATMSVTRLGAL